MSDLAERYARLCRAYVQLADRFQKLDVEHMTLRSKVIPLLKSLKAHHDAVDQLKQEKETLEEELHAANLKYEELKALEGLLHPDMQAALMEAEEQISLVETTVQEIDSDRDPDLSPDEKILLHEYNDHPDAFSSYIKPLAQTR